MAKCKKQWAIIETESGGTVEDKLFSSEEKAYQWWERRSSKYPDDMEIEIVKIQCKR